MTLRKTAWTTIIAATLAATSMAAHADKKEQTQRILSTQQAAVDDMARNVAEQPARQLAAGARNVIVQAVAEDKREATAKQVDTEIRKYLESAMPVVRASATKLSQSAIGGVLEERFTEDELKQLVGMLESPVLKKYQGMLPELSGVLLEKVVEDARGQVTPKLQTAEANIRKILDTATGGKLSQGGEAKPASATKPAVKK